MSKLQTYLYHHRRVFFLMIVPSLSMFPASNNSGSEKRGGWLGPPSFGHISSLPSWYEKATWDWSSSPVFLYTVTPNLSCAAMMSLMTWSGKGCTVKSTPWISAPKVGCKGMHVSEPIFTGFKDISSDSGFEKEKENSNSGTEGKKRMRTLWRYWNETDMKLSLVGVSKGSFKLKVVRFVHLFKQKRGQLISWRIEAELKQLPEKSV